MKRRRQLTGFVLILCLALSFTLPNQGNASNTDDQDTAYINVSAATLWTNPGVTRPVDEPSITNPVDLWQWTTDMTLDDKLWLVGKLETQALYGTKVTILEEDGDWAKVAVHGQPTPKNELGYPAWMPKVQLAYNQGFNENDNKPFALVTDPTAWIYNDVSLKDRFKELSFNTRLPVMNQAKDAVQVSTPSDGDKWISKDVVIVYNSEEEIMAPSGDDLVNTGKKFLGLPYLWAGTSGFGFDCSGFTHTIHKAYGITIPRDSSVQAVNGKPVAKDELQKGDLMFFAYEEGKGRVHHVSMYIGDGKMIHSPNSSRTVEIVSIDEPAYAIEYAGARRYIDDLPTEISTANMVTLVEKYSEEGAFADDSAAHALTVHLISVDRFEKQGTNDKVVKHMYGFNQLLDHQQENELISKRAYTELKANANALIRKLR